MTSVEMPMVRRGLHMGITKRWDQALFFFQECGNCKMLPEQQTAKTSNS